MAGSVEPSRGLRIRQVCRMACFANHWLKQVMLWPYKTGVRSALPSTRNKR
jgi:hypothetical protein